MAAYQACLDEPDAQVVYLAKGDLEVRTWPEADTFAFDRQRFAQLMVKANSIRREIEGGAIATSPEEISFEKCGYFICENERLNFSL